MNFLSLIKSYRTQVFLTLCCIFIANILSLALPWGIKMIIDDVLIRKDIRLLHILTAALAGVLVLQMTFNFLRKMMSHVIGESIVRDLREKIYWHIHKIPLADIRKISPPQILTRITGDVESIRRFILGEAIECIYAVLSLGFITAVLIWINPRLTLAALVTLPLCALMYFHVVPRLKERYRLLRDINGRLASRINEILSGIAVVRVFTAEGYEKSSFSGEQKKIFHIAKGNHAVNAGLWAGVDFFASLGVIAVLWIGGMDVIHQRMTAGALIAFYSYLGMLLAPLARLVLVNSSYQEASSSLNRINQIMEIEEDVSRTLSSSLILSGITGRIEFKNVSFGYSLKEDILKDINFSFKQGEIVGIVGPSGAGKTTLINLLIRFFDPQKGGIYIDSHDLKSLDLKSYRQNLAVVLQDDYLFSGSIRDNICYGNFDASDQEVKEAARIAQADSFIEQFKDGYLTQVGDRGIRLSSGQRQRIAVARALMRHPSILILDEATSALDAMTENRIQKAVRMHMKGKTVFIAAHRFSTIMEADTIIVLDKGRIIESGSHAYLLKKQGFYSRLYLEQFKENDQYSLAQNL